MPLHAGRVFHGDSASHEDLVFILKVAMELGSWRKLYGTECRKCHLAANQRQKVLSKKMLISDSWEIIMLRSIPTNRTIIRTRLVWQSASSISWIPSCCIYSIYVQSYSSASFAYLYFLLTHLHKSRLYISSFRFLPIWLTLEAVNGTISVNITIIFQFYIPVSGGVLLMSMHALQHRFTSTCIYGLPKVWLLWGHHETANGIVHHSYLL